MDEPNSETDWDQVDLTVEKVVFWVPDNERMRELAAIDRRIERAMMDAFAG